MAALASPARIALSVVTASFVVAGLALVACGPAASSPSVTIPPAPDAGPGDPSQPPGGNPGGKEAGADAAGPLTKLTVVGKVTASGIDIVARCGSKPPVRAQSDVNGRYTITADIVNCAPLVIEYTRESFIPNLRVIPLPPPAPTLVVDVILADANSVACGTECKTEDNSFQVPAALISPSRRGWVATASGMAATDLLPGELKDTTGSPIILFGFDYSEFFDQQGKAVAQFPDPVPFIIPLGSEAERKNVGDVRRDTTDAIEMHWYDLEKSTGRWIRTSDYAEVMFKWPCQPDDMPVDQPLRPLAVKVGEEMEIYSAATQQDLPNIIADVLTRNCGGENTKQKVDKYVVAGRHGTPGWHAWGISAPRKSCFVLDVKDDCNRPVAGATIISRGRFQPIRTESYTSKAGHTCIDTIQSEPECPDGGIQTNPDQCDYNYNFLGGELFWLNIEVAHAELSPSRTFENQELSRKETSCAKEDECLKLKHTFTAECSN